jgi:hypothetical protein
LALFELYGSHLAAFAADHLILEIGYDTGESVFTPPSADLYICPLCLHVFHRGAPNDLADPCLLTVEDVPPRSVTRGVPKTRLLTCKKCNNTLGTDAESDLEAALALRDLRPGHKDGHRKCTLQTSHAAVHAHLVIGEDRAHQFRVVGDASASGREGFFSDLRKELRFAVSMRGSHHAETGAALLKAAYLLAFASFGYSYVFSTPSMHEVRTRIANSGTPSPIDSGIVQFEGLPSGITGPSISIVQAPTTLQSILVTLTLRRKAGDPHVVGVFLPGPDATSLDLYATLADRAMARHEIQGTVLLAPAPGAQIPLRNPAARHALHHEWHRLLG